MNIFTKFFVFSVCFLMLNSAHAIKIRIDKNELLLLSSGVGDELSHYIVNKDKMASIASWDGQGEPALSNSEISSLVLNKHKAINGDIDSEIKKISLKSKNTNCNPEQKCPEVLWYYKVKVKGEKRATYIVLMNGEFVASRKK